MLNFPGYDVGESRLLFNGEIQSAAAGAGVGGGGGPTHRSPAGGYLHAFGAADPACYDSTSAVNAACSPAAGVGYAQSPLTGYPAATYGSYRLPPFGMSHAAAAAAVYDEQRKFDCCSKPELNCSSSTHGNYAEQVYQWQPCELLYTCYFIHHE